MTANDLKQALGEIGWTGAELARRIDVHKNTVAGWTTGAHTIPGAVAAYLNLMLSLRRLAG